MIDLHASKANTTPHHHRTSFSPEATHASPLHVLLPTSLDLRQLIHLQLSKRQQGDMTSFGSAQTYSQVTG